MKERIIILLTVIFVAIILLFVLKIHYKGPISESRTEADGVTMEIIDGTLTRTGADIIITDISGDNNIYGKDCKIEKKEKEKWQELETINKEPIISTMEGYMVNSEHELYMKLSWILEYGKLENGEYRIVKSCTKTSQGQEKNLKRYIYTEFTINDDIK